MQINWRAWFVICPGNRASGPKCWRPGAKNWARFPHRFRPKFEVIIAVPKSRYRFFIMDSINHKPIVIMIDFCYDVPVVSHKSVIPC